MRKILCFSVMLMVPTAGAQAADWVKLGASPTGVTIYYDREKATYQNSQVDAWIRVTYPKPQPLSGGAGGAASEMHTHYAIDCLARTIDTTGVEFYDADGGLLRTLTPDSKPEPISMQTPGGAVAKLYCQNW